MKLISENVGGNTHQTVHYVNELGLAEFVVQIDTLDSGTSSILVLRVPDEFTIDRWCYDRASPDEQQKMVEMEINRRRWAGSLT